MFQHLSFIRKMITLRLSLFCILILFTPFPGLLFHLKILEGFQSGCASDSYAFSDLINFQHIVEVISSSLLPGLHSLLLPNDRLIYLTSLWPSKPMLLLVNIFLIG